ncbi:ShlB/FhaC/HecB family hemolysin secretion/activation protein [Sphingorhabdus sp. Alg239-R122]|uniref:ShlB/FhaC/HecB family hemolysin secretion/activation protein n=1 Tax=Sphingorhabdus sp. Alg239-R122 TaxID=2305989 RepID=UPI0013DB76C4|nr:ShlB/FhaC/HecB family hemolysin secretion/activation protein [Sphingorhabdus sp. Alg239-R122]
MLHKTGIAGRTRMIAGISMLAMLSPALPAFAQANISPPTREEIDQGIVDATLDNEPRPLTVEGGLERAPCPLANPEFADIKFRLSGVEFTGLKMVGADMLTSSYADKVGQELPVAAICDIRDRAATTLREAGYLAAVQVPPQKISDGQVRLDVLMAKMTRVQIRGNAGPSEKALLDYVNKLTDQPVFNIKDAERYLLLARDIPGLDVRLALRPTDGAPGEVIGEFSVQRTPIYVDTTVQNYGSKSVGRFGALGRIRVNGITGLADETTASIFSTIDFDEQQVLQFGHSFKPGSEGLTIGGNFTYAWTTPDLGPGIDLNSETLIASLDATYPIVRSQARNLFGTVGFEYIDQDVRFGALPLTRDKLSVLYARLGYNAISAPSITGRDGFSISEPRWAVGGSLEVRQGLSIFGASKGCGPALARCAVPGFVPPSRAEGDPTAFVVRASGQFDYRPAKDVTITIAPRLQYAPDALLSYEEFSGGNYTIGRGFDPGILIGDSGVGFRSELRYGSLIPKDRAASAIQPYVFFDAAWVWNEDAAFDGLDPQSLYSAGGGVRANIRNGARIDATLAVPLKKAGFQTQRGDVRFLISLTMQLAPWRFGGN